MSRIGLRPIEVPKNVTVTIEGRLVKVKGPNGELQQEVARGLELNQEEGRITLARPNEHRTMRSQHGLARTLISNMVEGVSKGHEKNLEIHGVGYRAAMQGPKLVLNIGYSHQVEIAPPAGVKIEVGADEKTRQAWIKVTGADKAAVGQVAADIRASRKADPYKGKGIRYRGERVVLRQGKRTGK